MPAIDRIDHLVLTVADLEATCAFYTRVLGFERHDAPDRPTALAFGRQKINVHQADRTFEPRATTPTSGAGDFCLVTNDPLADWQDHLARHAVAVELGPVARTGALGAMTSLYLRDPDGNLVGISRYD